MERWSKIVRRIDNRFRNKLHAKALFSGPRIETDDDSRFAKENGVVVVQAVFDYEGSGPVSYVLIDRDGNGKFYSVDRGDLIAWNKLADAAHALVKGGRKEAAARSAKSAKKGDGFVTPLDESQLEFCQSESLNNRLLAPAGCGKTISLLYRCRELLERSDNPQRFLLLSFTNAAAAEMRERLETDEDFVSLRNAVRVTTLNSWGWRRLRSRHSNAVLLTDSTSRYFAVRNQLAPIVRKHANVAPLLSNKSVGPRDLMNVVDDLKSLRFDHTRHTNYDKFNTHIDHLEARGLNALMAKQFDELTRMDVLESPRGGEEASESRRQFYSKFFTFWRDAVERLHGELTFTFEDQKYWNYLDLSVANAVLAPNRYHHVLVDEFQDINPLDLALIDLIVKVNRASLTIVGDDDQAIFEWRGASPDFILEPETHFERRFTTHTLQVNYRSPRNIVHHSQKLISHNRRRVGKTVKGLPTNQDARIQIVPTNNIETELDFVTGLVRDTRPGRVAVIGRMRSQLIPYEIHFASNEIEFETATDLDLFQNKAFSDITNMLEIRDNKDQQNYPAQAVKNAIAVCNLIRRRPFSRKDRENLTAYLNSMAPASTQEAIAAVINFPGELSGKSPLRLHESATNFLNTESTAEALLCLDEEFDGLSYDLERAEAEIFYVDPPLQQLATLVERRGWTGIQLAQMIQKAQSRIREFNSQGEDDNGPKGLHQRPLHLMTATRSKGKEFETVVILGALDQIWPHRRTETEAEMEAERRLFYVAFTRAKRQILMLVGPDQAPWSPFIYELDLPGV